MSKPDWKDAPEWAGVLMVQNGFNGPCYCWAKEYADGAIAQWHEDIGRDHMKFKLATRCWRALECRP